MVRRRWGMPVAGLMTWLGLVMCAGQAVAAPPDAAQGRALYEIRCGGCHDRSVHMREARSARSFAQVHARVAHWDRQSGGLWRDDEIDAVTRYLNDRYYRFPCPAGVCDTDRG